MGRGSFAGSYANTSGKTQGASKGDIAGSSTHLSADVNPHGTPMNVSGSLKDLGVEVAKVFNVGPNEANTSLDSSVLERKLRTPTDALAKDPFKFSSLVYPRDVATNMENGHYMLFYVNVQNKTKYKYEDFDGKTVGDSYEYLDTGMSGDHRTGGTKIVTSAGANAAEVDYAKRIISKGKSGYIAKSDGVDLRKGRKPTGGIGSKFKSTSRITDSVAIYLPANVQDKLTAVNDGMATGLAGLAAAGGIDFINAMGRNDFEGAARELVAGGKTIIGEALKRSAAGLADLAMGGQGEGTLDLFNKAWGQAENPYMEVIFKNMELRKFTYSFSFSPRNRDERDDVQAIIQLFRFHMAPELKGGNHRYLTLPSTFDIHYMYQSHPEWTAENNFYSKIATCVLDNCDVDYTPDGVKSFADGSPTRITMSLSFTETELLTKDKINDGF